MVASRDMSLEATKQKLYHPEANQRLLRDSKMSWRGVHVVVE